MMNRFDIGLCLILAGTAGGCAASLSDTTGAVRPLECPQASEAVQGAATRMTALVTRLKAESQAMPPTAVAAWGRMFGKPGDGLASYDEYEKERVRVDRIIANATAKGCNLADGEKKIADVKTKMAEIRGN